MIEYSEYNNYITHNRMFNIVFSTAIAIITSVLLGLFLNHIGIINRDWGILAIIILLSVPVVVFIKEYSKYEGVIAYHYQLSDYFHGLIDRRVINRDYGKTHNIYDWKDYFSKNHPDGRWNYNVNTKYMERLAISRNNILTAIADQYAENRSIVEKNIQNLEEEKSEIVRRIRLEQSLLGEIESRLSAVSPSAKQYYLGCEKKKCLIRLDEENEKLTNCSQSINEETDKLKRHDVAFVAESNHIKQDYEIRSNKYAKTATKRIAKNGLKYEISSLKLPDYWITNPTKGV